LATVIAKGARFALAGQILPTLLANAAIDGSWTTEWNLLGLNLLADIP
jgi:hypothetical protein